MARAWVRLGDKTSHGGTVIQASAYTYSGGIQVARVGDLVKCPKKGHGTCPIVSGDNTLIVDGKPVARHGDKTSCGASLISSQHNSTADQLTSAATEAVTGGEQELSFEDFFSPYEEEAEELFSAYILVKDKLGNLLANRSVTVMIDGQKTPMQTDGDGAIKLEKTAASEVEVRVDYQAPKKPLIHQQIHKA